MDLITTTVAFLLVLLFSTLIFARSRSFNIPVKWPLIAFFFPLAIVIIDTNYHFLPVFSDAEFYNELAWRTTQAWREGEMTPKNYRNIRTQIYASLVAILYLFTGQSPFVALVLNTALWGLAVCYWLRLGLESFDLQSDSFGFLLIMYPSGIIYSASFLREAFMSLFLSITLLHTQRWFVHRKRRNILVGGLSLLFLSAIRPESLPIFIIVGVIIEFVEIDRLHQLRSLVLQIILSIILVSIFGLYDSSGYYNPFRLEFLESKRNSLTRHSNSYLEGLSYDSWLDIILFLPIRLFHFLFQPFPWVISNYHLMFATIDSLFIIIIISYASIGIIKYRSHLSREHIFLLLVALFSIIGYALVVSTKGAATRRRLFSIPILILFASLDFPRIQLSLKGETAIKKIPEQDNR